MIACLHINRLLWENVTSERGLLNTLQSGIQGCSDDRATAEIIPLRH